MFLFDTARILCNLDARIATLPSKADLLAMRSLNDL